MILQRKDCLLRTPGFNLVYENISYLRRKPEVESGNIGNIFWKKKNHNRIRFVRIEIEQYTTCMWLFNFFNSDQRKRLSTNVLIRHLFTAEIAV